MWSIYDVNAEEDVLLLGFIYFHNSFDGPDLKG